MVAGAEGSRGAEWLHGHHRLCGDVYVNYILAMPVLSAKPPCQHTGCCFCLDGFKDHIVFGFFKF